MVVGVNATEAAIVGGVIGAGGVVVGATVVVVARATTDEAVEGVGSVLGGVPAEAPASRARRHRRPASSRWGRGAPDLIPTPTLPRSGPRV